MGIKSFINSFLNDAPVLEQKGVVYSEENLFALQVYRDMYLGTGVDIFDYNMSASIRSGFKSNPNVHKVIMKIVGPALLVPVKVYLLQANNKKKEVFDTDLNYIFEDRVNEEQRFSDFLKLWLLHWFNFGETFTYGLEAPGYGITKLYNLPPTVTAIVAGNWREPVKGYRVIYNRDYSQKFPAECVKHVKMPNPDYDPLATAAVNIRGLSPLAPLDRTVKRNNAILNFSYYTFKNGYPHGLMSPDGEIQMNKDDKKGFWKNWRKSHENEDGKNTNKPMVSPIAMKWQEMGYKPVDLNMDAANKSDLLTIAGVFGVPDPLVDSASSGKWANMTEAKKDLWISCIMPALTVFRDAMNDFVVASINKATGKRYWIDFDYSGIPELQEDKTKEFELHLKEIAEGVISRNEYREMRGMETITDDPSMNERTPKSQSIALNMQNQNDNGNAAQPAA